MVTIKFIDNKENDRYIIDPSSQKLGRRYDENAESIQVIFPEGELDSTCTMIVKDVANNGIDLIDFKNNEIKDVTTTLSQFDKVLIGFVFTKENYAKYSSYKTFYFEPSLYPDNFEPREPEFKGSFTEIVKKSFVSVRENDGMIEFFNIKGDVVDSISINVGGIVEETDPTVPAHVKRITQDEIEKWNNKASTSYVDNKVANLVNSAPETLNTLGEIAKAIQENDNVVKALDSAIGNKVNEKDLSKVAKTGNYNDLSNKPNIPSSLSEMNQDTTHRVVTDAEKNTWNNKSNFSGNYNDLSNKPNIPDVSNKLEKSNIIAGENISITTNGNDITINSTGGGSSETATVLSGEVNLYDLKQGYYTVKQGSTVHLTQDVSRSVYNDCTFIVTREKFEDVGYYWYSIYGAFRITDDYIARIAIFNFHNICLDRYTMSSVNNEFYRASQVDNMLNQKISYGNIIGGDNVTVVPDGNNLIINSIASGGGSTGEGQQNYDLVIQTQEEFTQFYTSLDNGTCTAKSVLFIGKGNQDLEPENTFIRSDGKGLKLPETLLKIEGINMPCISIRNFAYDWENESGMFYMSKGNEGDYSIKGIYLFVDGSGDCVGFFNCSNIENCSSFTGYRAMMGVDVEPKKSVAFQSCNMLTNCNGTATGKNPTAFESCTKLIGCISSANSMDFTTGYGYAYCTNLMWCEDWGSPSGAFLECNNIVAIKGEESGGESGGEYPEGTPDSGQTIYDLVIRTQDEFSNWCITLDNGTCEAKSVLLIGDGGQTPFVRMDGKGLNIPPTICNIQGLNMPIIYIAGFTYNENDNLAGMYSAVEGIQLLTVPTKIDGINLMMQGSGDLYHFRNLPNLTNCMVNASSDTVSGQKRFGFYGCYRIQNCLNMIMTMNGQAISYQDCFMLSDCIAVNGDSGNGVAVSYLNCDYLSNCCDLSSQFGLPTPTQSFYNCTNVSATLEDVGGGSGGGLTTEQVQEMINASINSAIEGSY